VPELREEVFIDEGDVSHTTNGSLLPWYNMCSSVDSPENGS